MSNLWSLRAFFGSLYRCLSRGARAVFQVYPESIAQRELILRQALQAGFGGGLVVDYPHRYLLVKAYFWFHIWLRLNTLACPLTCSTKKRKEFLVLTCGSVPTSINDGHKGSGSEDDDDDSEDEDNGMVNNIYIYIQFSLPSWLLTAIYIEVFIYHCLFCLWKGMCIR